MKKAAVIIICFICAALFFLRCFLVRLPDGAAASVRYIYGEKNIETELSIEDKNAIIDILDGKLINIFDMPACGFDENVAVIINGKTFCIACDECGTVYYKERNGYISLNDDENIKLRTILSEYGFEWPCV